jgi:RNase P subunit RPR2
MKENTCKICNDTFLAGKELSNHVKKAHNLSSLEYTVQFLYDGKRPTCKVCESETRYSSFSFK